MHLLNRMVSDDVSKLNKLYAQSVYLERYHFRKNSVFSKLEPVLEIVHWYKHSSQTV